MKQKTAIIFLLIFSVFLSGCSGNQNEVSPLDKARTEVQVPVEVEEYQLPTSHGNVTITWSSNLSGTLSDEFVTIQGLENKDVSLTASFSYDGKVMTKLYNVTILADAELNATLGTLNALKNGINFQNMNIMEDLVLPTTSNGVTITWVSSNPDYLTNAGVITRPEDGEGNESVQLTATFSLNGESVTRVYDFTVLEATVTVTYEGYYDGAAGLDGDTLKTFLHNLIDDHTELSYDDLRQALQVTDEDPNNPDNVILIYTGVSVDSTWDYGATWNREHVWPRSLGNMDRGDAEHNDMHHVRPCNPSVNSSRGNDIFGTSGDSYYPGDEWKGDVARMIFYMVVRYEGDTSGEEDLEIGGVSGALNFNTAITLLLEWHESDPPSEFEETRNDLIYSDYQGNRNPFIDHPEFAELIWGTN